MPRGYEVARIAVRSDDRLHAALPKGARLVALDERGKDFTTAQFSALLKRMRGHLVNVERAMGVLMIATGIGFLTGAVSTFSIWLLETFPSLQSFG